LKLLSGHVTHKLVLILPLVLLQFILGMHVKDLPFASLARWQGMLITSYFLFGLNKINQGHKIMLTTFYWLFRSVSASLVAADTTASEAFGR
jgi:hypothetical protein